MGFGTNQARIVGALQGNAEGTDRGHPGSYSGLAAFIGESADWSSEEKAQDLCQKFDTYIATELRKRAERAIANLSEQEAAVAKLSARLATAVAETNNVRTKLEAAQTKLATMRSNIAAASQASEPAQASEPSEPAQASEPSEPAQASEPSEPAVKTVRKNKLVKS